MAETQTFLSLAERIRGGLVGLLVGDALGVPYEFNRPDMIPPMDQIEMTPPAAFRRSHSQVPPGTWSDDGAQALCLLASLLHCDRFDVEDFGRRLLNWYKTGYMAVDYEVFDIGNTTVDALSRLSRGVPAGEAGSSGETDNGNGSLMRVLPLALWHRGSDAELVADAQRSSCVTHAHPRAQVCCALYCLWARRLMIEDPDPWNGAVSFLRKDWPAGSPERFELDVVILGREARLRSGRGYVVDSLHSSRWASGQPDYQTAVRSAIALGFDTDTTACITGGIAGLLHGEEGIPARWRAQLRGQELVLPLMDQLLARWASVEPPAIMRP